MHVRNSIHFVQSVLVVYWSKIFFYKIAQQILHPEMRLCMAGLWIHAINKMTVHFGIN